jgi:hypothetical protein
MQSQLFVELVVHALFGILQLGNLINVHYILLPSFSHEPTCVERAAHTHTHTYTVIALLQLALASGCVRGIIPNWYAVIDSTKVNARLASDKYHAPTRNNRPVSATRLANVVKQLQKPPLMPLYLVAHTT